VRADSEISSARAAIDVSLRGAVERKDVPGVVALVTDRERVLYTGAFGVADVATGRALTQDALFRIASMTKPVTSVALMQLVEQGEIGLDDPASKYLPELADLQVIESFDTKTGDYKVRPASRPATVRHFLTHTSGLAYAFTSAIWRDFKPRAGETYPFGGRCCSIPASAGTTRPAPTSLAGWSKRCRARGSRIISASISSSRSR
jgi:methyl acetate hydrolase